MAWHHNDEIALFLQGVDFVCNPSVFTVDGFLHLNRDIQKCPQWPLGGCVT